MTPFGDSRHYNCDPAVLKGSFLCDTKLLCNVLLHKNTPFCS